MADNSKTITYTTETTISLTSMSWFYSLFVHSQKENDSKLQSGLEFAFLLDSGIFISVLRKPTYMMINQVFNLLYHDKHDTSKTLTIANQSEFSIEQYLSVLCFLSIDAKRRFFMIAFVVADF